MRRLRAVGHFLGVVLVLAAALWGAGAGAWTTFGKTHELGALSGPSCMIALVVATAWWHRTRRGGRTRRAFAIVCAVSALGLYVLLCGLHFARKPPTRFEFLRDRPMAFTTDPGLEGFLGAIYTFPARPDEVMSVAETELKGKGYRIDHRSDSLSAVQRMSEGEYGVSVEVSRGKATGQHFAIDGDWVHVEKRIDWVTVDIVEPDVVPEWARNLLP